MKLNDESERKWQGYVNYGSWNVKDNSDMTKARIFLKMLKKVVAKETLWIDPNRCNKSLWGKCKKDKKVTRLCHLIHTIAQIIPFFYS